MLGFLVHFTFFFVLALWVGAGAAVSFLVVPIVFERAPTRSVAGSIVTQISRRFDVYALLAGPLAVACVFLELAATRGAVRTLFLKLMLLMSMMALAAYSRVALAPELKRLTDGMGGALDTLTHEDPRRLIFRRLHGLSILCVMGECLFGALALALTLMSLSIKVG
ncbi:MAG: DUF4149 domain-containing protein [Myxococcaceae bacterium]